MRIVDTTVLVTLLATLAGGVALADNQPQRFGASPGIAVGPAANGVLFYPVTCTMGSGDVLADVWVRNNGAAAIAPGTQIRWQTSGGQVGYVSTGGTGLAPGGMIEAGAAPYPFTCTAMIVD